MPLFCKAPWLPPQVFAQRGFLMRVVAGSRDIEKMKEIDEALTKCIVDMGPSLQASTMHLQQVTYEAMMNANEAIVRQLSDMQARVCACRCDHVLCECDDDD
jgi:hypothetical protein